MLKQEFKPYYDIVIIGSGVSGLTSAAILSKAGYSVCVLESDSRVGGYLAGFRRKDFRFDTAIHWLNQCGPGGMVTRVFDFIGSDYPVPRVQTIIRRYVGDSFNYLLTDNPDELRNQWMAEFPHEKEGIIRFFEAAKSLGKSFVNFGRLFRSMETMNLFEKAQYGLKMLSSAIPFIKYLGYEGEAGLEKGLNKFFKEKKLHDVFCSEDNILSCLVPIGWAYFHDYQMPPIGGSQVFPEWLKYVTEYYGNEIFLKCRVTKILIENGQSQGVEFEHRGNIHSIKSNYVLAACDVETLYEKMLPPQYVKEEFKEKLRGAVLYSSSVTISIALDCPAEDLGFGEELIFITRDDVKKEEHCNGDPYTSAISILAPAQRDKTLAPEGCGTLTLYVAGNIEYNDFWKAEKDANGKFIRGEAYKKHKEEYAEILISRVEKQMAPSLRQHILFYDIATPVTHQRYTGNKNGSIMGAKPGKHNMQAKIAHHQTPVDKLILGGHWAELGGGVPIAVKSAINASLVLLKKENKTAYKTLSRFMDGKISTKEVQAAPCFKPYDNSWVQNPTPATRKALREEEVETDSDFN